MLAVDYDGTLINSFMGHAILRGLKLLSFRFFRPIYVLGEFVEVKIFKTALPFHCGAKELIRWTIERGFVIGIVTDRTLYSFVKSAELAGLDLSVFEFIHARKSWLNRFASVPEGADVLIADRFKGEESALSPLLIYIARRGFSPQEVLMIGDDERDVAAAAMHGFECVKVDRYGPNFAEVYCVLLNRNQ